MVVRPLHEGGNQADVYRDEPPGSLSRSEEPVQEG